MATTWIRPLHINKGQTVAQTIADRTDYAENPEKTAKGELVTGYGCNPQTVDREFVFSKKQYEQLTTYRRNWGTSDVLAYHVRQSFKPDEITPEEANTIGYELAISLTKGKHAFIVATHIDRAHIHNHVVFNSTTLDCKRKFKNPYHSTQIVRRISDLLCLEHGLSVIENPKPSKGQRYGDWLGDDKNPSWQNLLRQKIDEVLPECKTFDEFLAAMRSAGYEVNVRKKHITMKAPGQKRPSRLDTLRGDYTEAAIRKRIAGTRIAKNGHTVKSVAAPQSPKMSFLIDIQTKIQQGKGAGYEQWAKVFNLKEAAKTLMFLQDNGLADYTDLEKAVADATGKYNETAKQVKAIEQRQNEINELQKQISTYGKTRDTYTAYRQSGYSKKFKSEHESEIILHQAAKKFFDELGLKKLPSIKSLQSEFGQLSEEKRALYKQYQTEKEKMRELVLAKSNTDRILGEQAQTRNRETTI